METVRMTIRVPIIIKREIEKLLQKEFTEGKMRSMNTLVADALREYLKLGKK